MKKRRPDSFIYLILVFILGACDPGYVLYVHNRSGASKQVDVIYTPENTQHAKDINQSPSVQIYSNPTNGKVIKQDPLQVLRKDSITTDWVHSYTFLLPAGHTASLDHGIGGPPRQLIIINKRDSVNTDRHNGRLRSKPFFFPLHSVYSIEVMD